MSVEKTARNSLICKLYDEGKTNRQIVDELWKNGYEGLSYPESVSSQLSRLKRAGRINKTRHLKEIRFTPWKIEVTEYHALRIYRNNECEYCGDPFLTGKYLICPEPNEEEVLCPFCKRIERKELAEDQKLTLVS